MIRGVTPVRSWQHVGQLLAVSYQQMLCAGLRVAEHGAV